MADVVWDVKFIRSVVSQLSGDILWGFAINSKTSIPVMVIEEPAKPLLAHFKAQVGASGYDACLRKAFHNCDDARTPLGGGFLRHFERPLIFSSVHCHSHPFNSASATQRRNF